ncbi:MAG: M1 family metallopeptidase [Gemmatimonadota bacterium]
MKIARKSTRGEREQRARRTAERVWVGCLATALVLPGAAAAQAGVSAGAEGARPYFQQGVRYTVEATLDEAAETLHGRARMEYTNNSPDTLADLYFHLYLNAFRPGSLWARTERRARLDFGALQDPDYGFEHLTSLTVDGAAATLSYPHAPDSTVVRVRLPRPLEPGAAAVVNLQWDARPSTLCRRQCRRGRSYDFAQWYPRIAVYDRFGWQAHPLYPQGEFYGEFATYDVTLDLAEDQVVGGTGVPVAGDPGWRPSPWSPEAEVDHQRGWYGDVAPPPGLGLLDGPARIEGSSPGRKRVRFYAEKVHHFAWSTSPEYRYEQFRHGETVIRVLYRPGDLDWDLGAAARRTGRTLEWLENLMGPYPYPQLTNLHRLEGGGTEFPMVIMDGGPGQGLITHEGTHQYAHGLLANNEWKEAWLDEGMASFITSWFTEEVGGVSNPWAGTVERLAAFEVNNPGIPISLASEEFPDFGTYGVMAYSKPSVVLLMLREYVGKDVMRRILRTYYERFRFRHVTGEDFQRVAEEVAEQDLDWFFRQWVRSAAKLDYAVAGVGARPAPEGGYVVRVTVERSGDAWMPVVLQVGPERVRLTSKERVQEVEVRVDRLPAEVILDPETVLLQTDRSNDRMEVGAPTP